MNPYNNPTVPPDALSGVVSVAAGSFHVLYLKANGTVHGLGYDGYNELDAPQDIQGRVLAVAAGLFSSMALVKAGPATPPSPPAPRPAPRLARLPGTSAMPGAHLPLALRVLSLHTVQQGAAA